MVILGPIALFNNKKLTASSGKHLEDFSHAHIVPLIYKLSTSSKDTDYLFIRFDRDCVNRQCKLTTNKKFD